MQINLPGGGGGNHVSYVRHNKRELLFSFQSWQK